MKTAFLGIPLCYGIYFYNYNIFKSAELASKNFIELNEKYKINRMDTNILNDLILARNKLEYTLKIQLFINKYFNSQKIEDFIYRLEWMLVHLNSLNINNKQLNFDEDCLINFDTTIDKEYLKDNTETLHKKLRDLISLEENGSLIEMLSKFKANIMIPKENYENTFRKLIKEVLESVTIDELKSTKLIVEFIDDISMCFEATCEPFSKGVSKMIVNIARPISYDKAQQLAAHELTHHFQFILMQDLIEKFPEMNIIKDSMPLSMLLEGGAELAVDLIYDYQSRFKSLRNLLPDKFSDKDIQTILDVEKITWK